MISELPRMVVLPCQQHDCPYNGIAQVKADDRWLDYRIEIAGATLFVWPDSGTSSWPVKCNWSWVRWRNFTPNTMIQKWIWNLKCMLNLSWVEFDLNWLICACKHIWFDQQQHPMISELTGTWIRMGCEAIMTINDYLKQRWYHAEKNSWIKVAQEGKYRNRALRIGVAAGEATIEYANFDGDFGHMHIVAYIYLFPQIWLQ